MNKNTDWQKHLQSVYQNSNLSLKEAMKVASKTYPKKSKQPKKQTKTSKHVRFSAGEGLYQDVVNGINRMIGSKAPPLFDGEYHLPDSNWTGPGTRIKERIARGDKPLNAVDAASQIHDLEYNHIKRTESNPIERAKKVRISDEKALQSYQKALGTNPILGRLAFTGIKSKNILEDVAPTIAKQVLGEHYYGSKSGHGMPRVKPQGTAHQIIYKSLLQ